MTNQQLLDYVRAQLKAGARKEDITKILQTGGWSVQDAQEAYSIIEGVPLAVPVPPKPIPPAPTPEVLATLAATPAADLPDYKPASILGPRRITPIILKKKSNWPMTVLVVLIVILLALGGAVYAAMTYPFLAAYLPAPLRQWVTPIVSTPEPVPEEIQQPVATTTPTTTASSTATIATSTASTTKKH